MAKRFSMFLLAVCLSATAAAEDGSFFTDPSLLKPWDRGPFELRYQHPDIAKIAQRHDSVMVDQPEIHMAADSDYKGAKGDHLKQLADVARLAMIERIEAGDWNVVHEPGPNVVYIRWAITDLYLKKKKQKRGLLSYTPVGMVVHATAQAAIRDLWEKIDIVELGLMIEVTESVSGEVLAAGASMHGARKAKGQKQDLVTWEELDALFATIGEQTRCRLDNNKLPEAEKRQDCGSIIIEPEK
jgi:hypothetical protein